MCLVYQYIYLFIQSLILNHLNTRMQFAYSVAYAFTSLCDFNAWLVWTKQLFAIPKKASSIMFAIGQVVGMSHWKLLKILQRKHMKIRDVREPIVKKRHPSLLWAVRYHHQAFQVPKMEVLSLIRLFWGWVFPYISLTYCLYRWGFLHFRYLKCLVISRNSYSAGN